jgi:glycerophosphoryl diester phosphodiesterase
MSLPPLKLPRVVAHRGAASYAPENTLASLREARTRGASWVEFDVKLSGDGVAMLMHDDSLKRTAGLDQLALATPWTEIGGLDAGIWMDSRFAGQRVPSFVEAIACLGDENLGANIEIKPSPGREAETARAVVEILRTHWPAHLPTPLLSSFKEASLAAALEAAPEFPRAILIDEVQDDWRARAGAVGAAGVNTNGKKLSRARAGEIKAAGYLLSVYTINDAVLARDLVAIGVDCVITDAPDVIIAALGD